MSKNKKIKRKNENSLNGELIAIEQSWSGPLPPPQILEHYESVSPGSAKKIIKAFENQSAHRIEIETNVVKGGIINEKLGLIAGTIIVLAGFSLCAYLVSKEQSIEAITLFIVQITTLAGIFVYSKNSDKKERLEKASQVRRRN